MACPYFYPVERFGEGVWPKPPRLPLGDPYLGMCCVDPMREWRPEEAIQREFCNLGYARNKCSRFIDDNGPDAFRFSVTGDRESSITIYFVSEKNRSPIEHGSMEYSTETGEFAGASNGSILHRQARAYVESYIRRKTHPEEAHHPSRR